MRLAFVNPNRAHRYDADTVLTQPLGGSESSQVHLARALAANGHEVFLFTGTQTTACKSKVECRPIPDSAEAYKGFDAVFVTNDPSYAVLSRAGAGPHPLIVHWEHNLFDASADWQRVLPALSGPRDLFAFVSSWQIAHFQAQRLALPAQRCLTIRNAVSPAFENLFETDAAILAAKDAQATLIFASAPYKGLQPALSFFANPLLADAQLHLYTGLSHYAPNNVHRQNDAFWQNLLAKAAKQPGVVPMGVAPQPDMARVMRKAHVLFYPSIAEETSCIVALEAMAAGMAVVASDWGALSETCAGFADLIPVTANDKGEFSLDGNAFAKVAADYLERFRQGDAQLQARLARQIEHIKKHHLWSVRAAEVEAMLSLALHGSGANGTPPTPTQLYDAGIHFAGQGRREDGKAAYRLALRANPAFPEALNNLGLLLRHEGNASEALDCFEGAHALRPDNAMIEGNLAGALAQLGKTEEAENHYRSALAKDADDVNALNNLGNLLKRQGRREEAGELYQKAVDAAPELAEARLNLARLQVELGRAEEAQAAFAATLAQRPDWSEAAFSFAFSQFEQLYASEDEIDQRRGLFSNILAAIENHYLKATTAERAQAARDLMSPSHFFMAYQGKNDRDLMSRFGTLLHVLMISRFPNFAKVEAKPAKEADGRLRLGIVSPFFRDHSIWKIPLRGWLRGIDRQRFAVTCYALNGDNAFLDEARRHCERMVTGQRQLADWALAIRQDDPHILLYPDIGMDALALKLAALRLAPLQATTLGHPTTTGLPTMDVFFSSALMEPENGGDHYTEKLVRLPGLGVMYEADPSPKDGLSRQELGLPMDKFLFWCCQSLFKYTPSFDRRLAAIASQAPNARFVFIEHHDNPLITQKLLARFEKAFAALGLAAKDFCLFLPRLSPNDFAKASRLMDAFLDHDAWSGFNSCLESVAEGVLPLTLPGPLMRGRHAKAVLEILDLTELIASSEADYIAKAVRLAVDVSWRESLRVRLVANRPKLYGDMAPIRAMEEILLTPFC